jgi:UDP-N-acetyl-D-glucosamine/UDP-N-acetyl-D-galactosamine dehydrogenase
MNLDEFEITIVGLGYVGLPLAVEFGKKYTTYGFDINEVRISELKAGYDKTKELTAEQIKTSNKLTFTSNIDSKTNLKAIYIVTVPTPIDKNKKPDLKPLLSASESIGKVLKNGDIVIYESTVYPGCTEEDCVPVLEKTSSLKYNQDFHCGYSPERINPGDKINTLTKIKKVTAGSTPEIAEFVDQLYNSIIEAGTFKASSIKVAEASKAIENAQRDVNISFMNEISIIFDKMEIDTSEVLAAAGTKWNFLNFKPGLVGGHCLGVDPYYLIHKAETLAYTPTLIKASRQVNDIMGIFVANKLMKSLIKNGYKLESCKILILGITYKENCSDIRNSKVIDVYNELKKFGINVEVYDPWANKNEVFNEYGITLLNKVEEKYDGLLVAVAHNHFKTIDLLRIKNSNSILFDLKNL